MPWQLGTSSDLFQTVSKHCARGVNHLLFRPPEINAKNCGRTKASNGSRTFVYISAIVCSLAIGLYLCLPGLRPPRMRKKRGGGLAWRRRRKKKPWNIVTHITYWIGGRGRRERESLEGGRRRWRVGCWRVCEGVCVSECVGGGGGGEGGLK